MSAGEHAWYLVVNNVADSSSSHTDHRRGREMLGVPGQAVLPQF